MGSGHQGRTRLSVRKIIKTLSVFCLLILTVPLLASTASGSDKKKTVYREGTKKASYVEEFTGSGELISMKEIKKNKNITAVRAKGALSVTLKDQSSYSVENYRDALDAGIDLKKQSAYEIRATLYRDKGDPLGFGMYGIFWGSDSGLSWLLPGEISMFLLDMKAGEARIKKFVKGHGKDVVISLDRKTIRVNDANELALKVDNSGIDFLVNGKTVHTDKVMYFPELVNKYGVSIYGKGTVRIERFAVTVLPEKANLEKGLTAMRSRKYEVALSHLRPLAVKSGRSDAQWALGLMYAEGAGVKKDPRAAARWLKKAADQNDCRARLSLAELYGWGPKEVNDPKKSLALYKKVAAVQGACQSEAEYRIGVIYGEGIGVKKDETKAIEWLEAAVGEYSNAFPHKGALYALGVIYNSRQDYGRSVDYLKRAAELNEPQSLLYLGVMYAQGQGVSPDLVESCKWFMIAEMRYPPGQLKTQATDLRTQVETQLPSEQKKEARARADKWVKSHR